MLRARRALTLLEVAAALVIMSILAAVLYPTIGAQLRAAQSGALGKQLDALREAIANYETNVGQFPMRVVQLVVSPTTGALDLCGSMLSGAERNRWRGPYLTRVVTGDMPVGDYVVRDTFLRVPPTTTGGQSGMLQIRVADVDTAAAAELEAQFDGSANFGSGSILWAPTTAPVGTLTFQIPVRGC